MGILVLILLIVAIVYLYQKSDRSEDLIILKLIGYFLLGSFTFTFNGLPLPIGFVIYLFMKPKQNVDTKRWAAILGLIGYLSRWFF